jgi:hypothetical protein
MARLPNWRALPCQPLKAFEERAHEAMAHAEDAALWAGLEGTERDADFATALSLFKDRSLINADPSLLLPILDRPITSRVHEPNYRLKELNSREQLKGHHVLISVVIAHPLRPLKMREVLLASHQRLSDLKEMIVSVCSLEPEGNQLISDSSYFFIEGTFYNSPNGYDYVEPIARWKARQQREQVQEIREDVCLSSLSVQLLHPYVFCHRGNCEHHIIFTDVCLHANLDGAPVPRVLFEGRARLQKCAVCNTAVAESVTFDDPAAPTSPCFLCARCDRALHAGPADQPMRRRQHLPNGLISLADDYATPREDSAWRSPGGPRA